MKKIAIKSPKYGLHFALIDDGDYDLIKQYRWHIDKRKYTTYATANVRIDNKWTGIYMHRLIMGNNKIWVVLQINWMLLKHMIVLQFITLEITLN